MKLADLAAIMGVSVEEARRQMEQEDLISVSLTERRQKESDDKGIIQVL